MLGRPRDNSGAWRENAGMFGRGRAEGMPEGRPARGARLWGRGAVRFGRGGYRRRRDSAIAAAVPPATAPTPAAAGMPTFAALRPVR